MPKDAQNWLVGSADIKKAFHQLRIPTWLQAFFFLHSPKFSHTGKMIDQKRFAPDSPIYSVLATLLLVLYGRRFFCQDVTDRSLHAHRECRFPHFVRRGHYSPLLLGSKNGLGSAGSRWSYADNFGVLAPGADCTEVHLARLVADLQKADLDVHDISLQRVLSRDGQTDITHSLSRTDGLFAPSHLRWGNGARPRSRVFFRCSAIVGLCQSLMQASSSRGREHLEESYGFSAVLESSLA